MSSKFGNRLVLVFPDDCLLIRRIFYLKPELFNLLILFHYLLLQGQLLLQSYFTFGFGLLDLLFQAVDFLDSRHQNSLDVFRVTGFACEFCLVLCRQFIDFLQVREFQIFNCLLDISQGTLAALALNLKLLFTHLKLLQLLLQLLNLKMQGVVFSLSLFLRAGQLLDLRLQNIVLKGALFNLLNLQLFLSVQH